MIAVWFMAVAIDVVCVKVKHLNCGKTQRLLDKIPQLCMWQIVKQCFVF